MVRIDSIAESMQTFHRLGIMGFQFICLKELLNIKVLITPNRDYSFSLIKISVLQKKMLYELCKGIFKGKHTKALKVPLTIKFPLK